MSGHIPPDAFDRYLAMGSDRSYSALAKVLDVSKQAVVKCAAREGWQERIAEIEAKAREHTDKRAVETLQDLNEHEMKLWRLVETRAVQALRDYPIATGMDGARALDLATKNMRLIRGEPTERTETIEALVRREAERFLTVVDEDDGEEHGDEAADEQGSAGSEAPAA